MDIENNNLLLVEIKHLIQTEDMDIWNYKNELTTLIDEAIARQSATSEEVAEAIDDLTILSNMWQEIGQPTKEIDLAITALQAYQPWVSVGDRLPNNIPVMIYSQFGIGIGNYNPVLSTWVHYGKSHNCTVTHWKPLPEPPKGETP